MKQLSPEQITAKLFTAPGARPVAAGQLSDPLTDTPMQVTLDQLRPYEHNPRFIRNPLYEELKASIRERGLDQPPPITRRPGATQFVIRNGGNTRLSILGELWQETRDEQFFKIHCLFRPWNGELSALLGHLAENDLHGQLTFIERAISVAKAKAMLEEDGEPLTQRELSKQLAAGGYSVAQPHISRMLDTLEHLLPAIPQLLYQGLGRPHIERLIVLRNQAMKLWIGSEQSPVSFSALWLERLARLDNPDGDVDIDQFERDLQRQLSVVVSPPKLQNKSPSTAAGVEGGLTASTAPLQQANDHVVEPCPAPPNTATAQHTQRSAGGTEAVSRVEQIRQLANRAMAQQDDLPVSVESAWHMPDDLQSTKQLRQLIAQQAVALARFGGCEVEIQLIDEGLGFALAQTTTAATSPLTQSVQLLLSTLAEHPDGLDWQGQQLLPAALFNQLLIGSFDIDFPGRKAEFSGLGRLPDPALLSLIYLTRLARRLVDLIKEKAQ